MREYLAFKSGVNQSNWIHMERKEIASYENSMKTVTGQSHSDSGNTSIVPVIRRTVEMSDNETSLMSGPCLGDARGQLRYRALYEID
jgi:hypothetical protein